MSKRLRRDWMRVRLRTRRTYLALRAFQRRRELSTLINRTADIKSGDLLVFATLRNERVRLPYFLQYYRRMGIEHFLIVDNDSDDGGREYLASQSDVSVWHTKNSYKSARYGMDWMNFLLRRYGVGHWCLTVDPDELMIYPHCDTRPLKALTGWLDESAIRSFSAMLLDVYPKGPIGDQAYGEGQNPLEIANWFDPGNYAIRKNGLFQNLWIQGGPRARAFFRQNGEEAPALNKIPLVRWERGYVYVSSTHMLLPRSLNKVYDEKGGEKASGMLLHTKFLSSFVEKSAEEMMRDQHYAGGREYRAYLQQIESNEVDLWCPESVRFENWQQLDELGLISQGNWA